MILIKSIEEDISTNDVVKWLLRFNANFLRLNDITKIKNIRYVNHSFYIELTNGYTFDLTNVTAYWYRRGIFKFKVIAPVSGNKVFDREHESHICYESKSAFDFFISFLKKSILCIGDSVLCTEVNKNIVLETARKLKLNVPEFIITTKKPDIEAFLQVHKNVITKPIHLPFTYSTTQYWFPTYTEKINRNMLFQMPECFPTTLFQNEIQKKFEVRTFYLKGKFYSMAIFSQRDNQTKTDFRLYNYEKPNRNVPFKLPTNVEKQLDKLMCALKFESGSIDMIYSLDKKYYFLEINPIGQFGMVSYPCNYYIEKKIAEILLKRRTK